MKLKLSEYIKELEKNLKEYGDGEVYMLDEYGFHCLIPVIYPRVKYDNVWDDKEQDLKSVVSEVSFEIDSKYNY